ncbi:MAG TPA: hypothetical protein VJ984_00440 [Xanthomonadales bacterium]|nr:hypothetical protein [Xanthomonadales bacterium]
MNRVIIAVILLACTLVSLPAVAQDNTRNWENGAVVVVTEVDTHDGMFNAYINDLNNVWRRFMEQQMEDGLVLNYGMYSNPSAREGEPDLYLTVTYANWAAFDTGNEYFEKIGTEIMGSLDDMRNAGLDRSKLRTIMSTQTMQQIVFSDAE